MFEWNVSLNMVELTFALLSAALVGALITAPLFRSRIQKLKKQLGIDDLTKLYNSMEFNRRLSLEITQAKNSHQPLSLVLLDIDHFKRVNDSYGYKAGDLILMELSGLIKSRVRHMDLVFRYKQGDEFAVLMSETEVSEALALIEKLQEELQRHNFPVPVSPNGNDFVSLTLSAGIVGFNTSADSVETLAERAELALRNAKQFSKQGLSIPANLCESARGQFVDGTFATTLVANGHS